MVLNVLSLAVGSREIHSYNSIRWRKHQYETALINPEIWYVCFLRYWYHRYFITITEFAMKQHFYQLKENDLLMNDSWITCMTQTNHVRKSGWKKKSPLFLYLVWYCNNNNYNCNVQISKIRNGIRVILSPFHNSVHFRRKTWIFCFNIQYELFDLNVIIA